jgi:hypothetical protein
LISQPGPFDIAAAIDDSAVLIRYRNQPGYAVLNLRKSTHPILAPATAFAAAGNPKTITGTDFMLASLQQTEVQAPTESNDYRDIDTSDPSHPEIVATVTGTKQRLVKRDTGTLFLLSDSGLTVVLRPR